MSSPHALLLPYPAQGHVIPMMELSHCLVEHGFTVTFVNTEFNHHRIVAALSGKGGGKIHHKIRLVSIPDGLAPGEDRNDLGRLCEASLTVVPGYLEEMIVKINEESGDDDGRVGWMIADENMAWGLEVAEKMGIRTAAFWPASTALLVTMMSIPKLIDDGILDENGLPKRCEMIKISPGMPPLKTTQLSWNYIGESKAREAVFRFVTYNNRAVSLAEFIICNSFFELESPTFDYMPSLVPIGPLTQSDKQVGTFWPEDASCIHWLDEQPANSVIYVAFGSFTIMDESRFQELALGLELTGRPFLWVVRPDLTDGRNDAYPDGFLDRIEGRGMIVDWAPQQKVLAHPSVACFVSHCGWNSTLEGVRNGVPFICRPYFTDQFLNQNYICDVWKVGLRMDPDEDGTVTREQMKARVEELLGDESIKAGAQKWKELASRNMREGGSSYENFKRIVNAMKSAIPL